MHAFDPAGHPTTVADLLSDPAAFQTACRDLGLRLVVLFGSLSDPGRAVGPETDVDLAILPSRGDAPPDLLTLYDVLGPPFSPRSIDVVRLDRADPLLRHEAMSPGLLLFGDVMDFLEYRAFAYRDFIDSAGLRRLEDELFRKKMARLKRDSGAAA